MYNDMEGRENHLVKVPGCPEYTVPAKNDPPAPVPKKKRGRKKKVPEKKLQPKRKKKKTKKKAPAKKTKKRKPKKKKNSKNKRTISSWAKQVFLNTTNSFLPCIFETKKKVIFPKKIIAIFEIGRTEVLWVG